MGGRFQSVSKAGDVVVPIAPVISRQVSFSIQLSLLTAIGCFIFGHQTKDAYVIMGLTTTVLSQYNMSGFSPMVSVGGYGQHQRPPFFLYFLNVDSRSIEIPVLHILISVQSSVSR